MKNKILLPFFDCNVKFNFNVEDGIEFLCSNTEFIIANEIIKQVLTNEGLKKDIEGELEELKEMVILQVFDEELKRPTKYSFDASAHKELYYLVAMGDYNYEYGRWKQAMKEKYSCDISITSKGNNFNILVTVVRN